MAEQVERGGDLVLSPGEYAFIRDETKGQVNVYVGPNKVSLAATDRPVKWNERERRYDPVQTLQNAVVSFPFAREGQYIVLENPAEDEKNAHPSTGTSSPATKLLEGRKVHIQGPSSFPLWPGQTATAIDGHHLKTNEYLIVRVYNEEASRENWGKAVMKPQEADASASKKENVAVETVSGQDSVASVEVNSLTMGKKFIVQGTEYSFYIPPTGIEVIQDGNKYVRNAVTLERLEFCVLLDENGNKRYVEGPAVVFPRPTETFISNDNVETYSDKRKFRAVELNDMSGIYVKVIEPYTDSNNVKHEVGEELFITGKDQAIYFPRKEHAIIQYEGRQIHYAIAIPKGEGRYVMNRTNGEITLIHGPKMYLPDPRTEVIVRRILDPSVVELYYPGNKEAVEYNRRLLTLASEQQDSSVVNRGRGLTAALSDSAVRGLSEKLLYATASEAEEGLGAFVGDEINRKAQYTPPRTLTLNTKFDGAVRVSPWNNYAVMVISKDGRRRVEVGPSTILLEYDEELERLSMSTETPKNNDRIIKTVYLRVLNNTVSDEIEAETSDLVNVKIRLSYRVNFEGDEPEKWFAEENYIAFLTERMRSTIRGLVKQLGIEEFYKNYTAILRDAILGVAKDGESGPCKKFDENNMKIVDVEVLWVDIDDPEIAKLLVNTQRNAFAQTIDVTTKEKDFDIKQRKEAISRKLAEIEAETFKQQLALEQEKNQLLLNASLSKLESENQQAMAKIEYERAQNTNKATVVQESKANELLITQASQAIDSVILEANLAKKKAIAEQDLAIEQASNAEEITVAQAKLEQRLSEINAETKAVVDKFSSVSPDFAAALQMFADKQLVAEMTENLSPLAMIGGESVVDVLMKLLGGVPALKSLNWDSKGQSPTAEASGLA